ncbi:MAG: hypothetical protein A3B38_01260 [Candidatus Levybacteria bacterium RIFCSPLOWO2_01_FULL_36_13]|nr:MAG: hypothetical protein A2684_02500 [Candidatus Levybacteria bacterium RIFCSPHIGHO2_01_FULL_36_15b]OGH35513.1 MAG: hypothetical protein A3B38_01260 [Candidatus Levybacteria bacterium RIFCSPLOWO2_01_FULL_36_13]
MAKNKGGDLFMVEQGKKNLEVVVHHGPSMPVEKPVAPEPKKPFGESARENAPFGRAPQMASRSK